MQTDSEEITWLEPNFALQADGYWVNVSDTHTDLDRRRVSLLKPQLVIKKTPFVINFLIIFFSILRGSLSSVADGMFSCYCSVFVAKALPFI